MEWWWWGVKLGFVFLDGRMLILGEVDEMIGGGEGWKGVGVGGDE